MMRVAFVKVSMTGIYEWQEAMKLVNEGYRKAGVPWRSVWQSAMFGEMGNYVTVTPVKNMAQFDQGSPMMKLTEAERTKYLTLIRNSVEETRYVLSHYLTGLSLDSGRKTPPVFARVTTVKTRAGKGPQFEELLKDSMLPALKRAEVRDYWVNRVALGGQLGEYHILQLFDRWEEMDRWLPGEKLFGGKEAYERFLSRISEVVESADSAVIRTIPELGYGSEQ